MEGVIVNFRGSHRTKHNSQMIVQVKGVTSKEKAEALAGKHIVWASPAKKEIKGEIKSAHGNKGAVRVKFEKGMPGQAIGQKILVQ